MSYKQLTASYSETTSFPMACGPRFQYDRWRVLMRVLFSTIGLRGEPVVALCVALEGTRPAQVRRVLSRWPRRPQSTLTAHAAGRKMMEATVAKQFETLTSAAQECDVIVAATALTGGGLIGREKLGIPYVLGVLAACTPVVPPSAHHAPPPLPPLPGQAPPHDERQ
jgi:vancomycin aglycone glucosyltransferase